MPNLFGNYPFFYVLKTQIKATTSKMVKISNTPHKLESKMTTTTTKRNTNQIQTIAGVLGNVLEWYDFALYGFFSDIIAQVFFPPGQDNLLLSYIVFGGAFVARPFGGLIAGHIGDKHGRKRALVMSMISMSIPTFVMGCLPGYDVIGGWSTALLIICRLAQGLSVGGQLPASVVYTVETKPRGERRQLFSN